MNAALPADHAACTLEEAARTRRSIRAYLDTPVSREVIERILCTAATAPSGSNTQPWRVWALRGSALARLADDVLIAASPDGYLQPADLSARHCQLFVVDLLYLLIAQSNFDRTTRLLAESGAAVAPRRRPMRGGPSSHSAARRAPAHLSKEPN